MYLATRPEADVTDRRGIANSKWRHCIPTCNARQTLGLHRRRLQRS